MRPAILLFESCMGTVYGEDGTWLLCCSFFSGEADQPEVSTPSCAPVSETTPLVSESGNANSADLEKASTKLEEDQNP